jgi:hypothetical protein
MDPKKRSMQATNKVRRPVPGRSWSVIRPAGKCKGTGSFVRSTPLTFQRRPTAMAVRRGVPVPDCRYGGGACMHATHVVHVDGRAPAGRLAGSARARSRRSTQHASASLCMHMRAYVIDVACRGRCGACVRSLRAAAMHAGLLRTGQTSWGCAQRPAGRATCVVKAGHASRPVRKWCFDCPHNPSTGSVLV